ncbi:Ger(x)C family spore germination protein [Rossellomorea yichunensis]|uniref:Ger(x)C family spore germination protein n=1 Tax=Rossellomorea yichunensis TaxID=3077331 RepID=UPI0028E02ED9|nr:Ger(x)C family spore germination protein [Rossellomorea sp. YC4-1]MDT9027812.1 Ger(x)C family spore germination protein [Rossellomorea sp. YC4-1]
MRKILIPFISVFLLTGCWDQSQIKDIRIINGVSFDTAEETDKILGTVRAINIRGSGGGKFEIKDEFYTSEKETVAQIEMDLQNKVSGNMEVEKSFIIIVGDELAKTKGISSLLEPIYRSVKGNISSQMVISEGKGDEILSLKEKESPIAFEINNLLLGGTTDTTIPKETIFTVWNDISDKTTDAFLPYIKKDKENKLKMAGTALFNGDKFTGYTLTDIQTTLLLLLRNELESRAKLTIEAEELSQPFTLDIQNVKTKMDVTKENGKVTCIIKSDLDAKILSYYENNTSTDINKLKQLASKELTKKVEELTDLLIQAESDALGIAKEISTKYYDTWNPETWKQEYQQVEIKPNVNVEIIGTHNIQ